MPDSSKKSATLGQKRSITLKHNQKNWLQSNTDIVPYSGHGDVSWSKVARAAFDVYIAHLKRTNGYDPPPTSLESQGPDDAS